MAGSGAECLGMSIEGVSELHSTATLTQACVAQRVTTHSSMAAHFVLLESHPRGTKNLLLKLRLS